MGILFSVSILIDDFLERTAQFKLDDPGDI